MRHPRAPTTWACVKEGAIASRLLRATSLIVLGLLLLPAAPAAAREADLALAGVEIAPATVEAGRTATVAIGVKARRPAGAGVEAAVWDEQGQAAWQATWPPEPLDRRQTVTVSAEWPVPAEQAPGRYMLVVQLRDGDGNAVGRPRGVSFSLVGGAAAPDGLDAEEAAVADLINAHRAAHGRPPLAVNPALAGATRWMSQDMAARNYVGHTDSLGRDPFQRMADFGYGHNTWKGENIAAGYATAAAVVAGWQASPGHNANLLNPDYRAIGIGRAHGAGSRYGWYWTADFGGE